VTSPPPARSSAPAPSGAHHPESVATLPFPRARFLEHVHAQTMWPAFFRRHRPRELESACLLAPDGYPLAVDALPTRQGAPGVLMLHGLEGSSRSSYILGLLAGVEARGWNGASFSFRSCEPPGARAPGPGAVEDRIYHSGATRDLEPIVAELRRRWGDGPLAVVGFSLGANLALKWLGELGDRAPVAAGAAVSAPFDLAACLALMDRPGFFPWLYRHRLLRTLRRKAVRFAAHHPGRFDGAAIARCQTFREYDDLFTSKVFGFAGADDYYAQCSSGRFLPGIRRPTLIVSATDDPLIPGASIPRQVIAANPALEARIFDGGGHLGFVTGSALRAHYLVDDLVLEFLAARLV
jgi:predicted alpha/beta-fold hydrolase